MRIAILEDDLVALERLTGVLSTAGYAFTAFDRGNALLQALRTESFDLFILDWNLPDLTGLNVVEWIRNNIGDAVPVLLLTSRSNEEDIVVGLSAGADDFIIKPFQPAILMARLAALVRRTQPAQAQQAIELYGSYTFDLQLKCVKHSGVEITLTAKEFQLALLLFRSVNRAVSRQHVLATIWGLRADIPTRTLDSHIARLRTKLTLRPENGYQLKSVHGFGYRLEDVVL